MTRLRAGAGVLIGSTIVAGLLAAPAAAAVPHTVQPGETLWSIAAASNFTTRTVAAFNGLPENALVVAGQTIQVPTVAEGAAALQSAGITPASPAAAVPPGTPAAEPATPETPAAEPASQSIAPAPGMGHIDSPWGQLHLSPAAAQSWNAMDAEAQRLYGVDLHPTGTLSAYRTYEQQAQLYDAYLSGTGSPANPPGTSAHEVGAAVDVPSYEMRHVIDHIGSRFGWAKTEAPGEWWHLNFIGG